MDVKKGPGAESEWLSPVCLWIANENLRHSDCLGRCLPHYSFQFLKFLLPLLSMQTFSFVVKWAVHPKNRDFPITHLHVVFKCWFLIKSNCIHLSAPEDELIHWSYGLLLCMCFFHSLGIFHLHCTEWSQTESWEFQYWGIFLFREKGYSIIQQRISLDKTLFCAGWVIDILHCFHWKGRL